MADLIFLTKPGLFQRGEDGVISRSFYCQFIANEVIETINPESVLWIVTKSGNQLSLQSRLVPDLIQRFDEGKMSGWYLISCSASFGGHLDSGENSIEIPGGLPSVQLNTGDLALLDDIGLAKMNSVYRSTLRRTGLSLERDLNRRILKDYVNKNRVDLLKMNIDQIDVNLRARFFESELAIHATFINDSDVFRSSAKEVFAYINGLAIRDLVTEPTGESKLTKKRHITSIDCRLREFTEDDFMSRTMVWNPANFSADKAKLGLLKTNLAEKRHQKMLTLLVNYLINAGIKPFGSPSIDLAVVSDGTAHLFEIKSSTENNFKDQLLKGCGQLAEYSCVYQMQNNQNVKRHLIIETPNGFDVDLCYLRDVCFLMGCNLIEFNFDVPWPERCQILKEINCC